MAHAKTKQTSKTRVLSVASVALFAGLSGGCQLIVDFNRGLIDSGTVDGSFFDAGDAGFDSGVDALPVPDAVSDVILVDALPDSGVDAKVDATLDGGSDAHVGDSASDVVAHDAAADTATEDAKSDAPPKDAAPKTDAVSDAADAG